jgi:hypothetical protein
MSNSNTNRKVSITRSQLGQPGVEIVDLDYAYEKGSTHLILELSVERDFSTLKSRENLMRELEGVWNAFLGVLKDERLISDSSSNETTGPLYGTNSVTPTGHVDMIVRTPSETRYHLSGSPSDQNSRRELEIG